MSAVSAAVPTPAAAECGADKGLCLGMQTLLNAADAHIALGEALVAAGQPQEAQTAFRQGTEAYGAACSRLLPCPCLAPCWLVTCPASLHATDVHTVYQPA